MRTKWFVFLSLLVMLGWACSGQKKGTTYGEALTLDKPTKISAIMAEPESFVDKDVLIEGEILDVCEMQGCWIEIASDTPGEKFKVKVDDGVIVFPTEAKGKKARAEGTVYRIEMNEKDALAYFKHIADEKGMPFDSTTVTGPMTIYQLKGASAVILQ